MYFSGIAIPIMSAPPLPGTTRHSSALLGTPRHSSTPQTVYFSGIAMVVE